MTIDQEISDFAAAILLRHFHTGEHITPGPDRLLRDRDRAVLLGYWSISAPVRSFVTHLRHHPHEIESELRRRLNITDGLVRGRIDARQTWLHRAQTGNHAAIASHEPQRLMDIEINQLLAWVLRQVEVRQIELLDWQSSASPYRPLLEEAAGDLAGAARTSAVASILQSIRTTSRPSAAAFRAAARSRRPVYRQALQALDLFLGVEAGDASAISVVLHDGVLAPLEPWRRWELAVGVAIGEALGEATGTRVQLRILAGDSTRPIVAAGPFDIYWQQRTAFAKAITLEPSEARIISALRDYGFGQGTDRPDLVIVDRRQNLVVALVEVKYSAGDSAQDRFREAVSQIVRYSRGYGDAAAQVQLVGRSLVALSSGAPTRLAHLAAAPGTFDFTDLRRPHALQSWAHSLLAEASMPVA